VNVSLDKRDLGLFFGAALALTLFGPNLRLFYFAPFVVTLLYQKPLTGALWPALGCGLILDLLASGERFGINATLYALSAAALFPLRRHFFADSLSTLPLMTFFFSLLVTTGHLLLTKKLPLTFNWFLSDMLLMPLADAAYAFCCFTLPWLLLGKRPRKGKEYFLD